MDDDHIGELLGRPTSPFSDEECLFVDDNQYDPEFRLEDDLEVSSDDEEETDNEEAVEDETEVQNFDTISSILDLPVGGDIILDLPVVNDVVNTAVIQH